MRLLFGKDCGMRIVDDWDCTIKFVGTYCTYNANEAIKALGETFEGRRVMIITTDLFQDLKRHFPIQGA